MPVQFEKWFRVDLSKKAMTEWVGSSFFTNDNLSNIIGVELYDGMDPVDIPGTIQGIIILPNDGTITVNGSRTGNKAWIELPSTALALEGMITITIRATVSGRKVTLVQCRGRVNVTDTGMAIDPDDILPHDTSELMTLIGDLRDVINEYTDIIMVQDTQPDTETNKLWLKKTTPDGIMIPTMEDLEEVDDEVSDLKSNINVLLGAEMLNFEKGYYNTVLVGETFTPSISSSNAYYCAHKACSAGDVFSISVKGGGNASGGARAYIFVDSNNVCLQVSDASTEYNNAITAPENSAHIYINNLSTKPSYYAVYGNLTKEQIAALQTWMSALGGRVEYVENEIDLTLLNGAVWENGTWTSWNTYPPMATESKPTRVRTNISLTKPLYMVDIAPNDSNYSYIYSAFTENGANISFNNAWQSGKIVITSNVPIKYIYLAMRRNNNSNVTPAIAQYLDLYPHEVKDIKDIVSYCQSINNQISAENAGIYKIRVMSHNVGKFNYGNSGGYSGDDAPQKLIEWKNMYSKLEPDILLGQENVLYFDANHTITPATDLFAPLFPNYFGNGTYATFIRSKPPITDREDISLSVTVDGTTYERNASKATITINGKSIVVISAHLSPGQTENAETARELQADQLITALSNYDYVILCGDFNSSEETFFAKFKDAGYTCVNHGYWGTIETISSGSIDNIMVKGFVPYNIICSSSDKCTSDHYPVVSDLYLN